MNKRTLIAIILIVSLLCVAAVAYAGQGKMRGGKGCPGPCPNSGTRITGTIASIDSGAKTFQLSAQDVFTVKVTANTVIKSGPDTRSFSDLQVGQNVCACGTLDGKILTANMVNIRPCTNR